MRRQLNDRNWQLTRNLYVCKKHFPNEDTISGVPDFGSLVTSEFSTGVANQEEILSDGGIQVMAGTNTSQVGMEEIEVDAADWLPKTVSHQFKEQFIGNDPRYIVVRKDNIVAAESAHSLTSGQLEENENTTKHDEVYAEGRRYIETETGEMYEILSVEEPLEMVRTIMVSVGSDIIIQTCCN